jgi:hypothetical protein
LAILWCLGFIEGFFFFLVFLCIRFVYLDALCAPFFDIILYLYKKKVIEILFWCPLCIHPMCLGAPYAFLMIFL